MLRSEKSHGQSVRHHHAFTQPFPSTPPLRPLLHRLWASLSTKTRSTATSQLQPLAACASAPRRSPHEDSTPTISKRCEDLSPFQHHEGWLAQAALHIRTQPRLQHLPLPACPAARECRLRNDTTHGVQTLRMHGSIGALHACPARPPSLCPYFRCSVLFFNRWPASSTRPWSFLSRCRPAPDRSSRISSR
jgi:hypothetical protein